ncbi:unnamed protein product [Rhizophagus irregularis]|nr:unnamed protein product [Rhizophagus irregularis]
MDETPKNLWKYYMDRSKYQDHITIPTIDSTIESENVNEEVVYIGDLEKRKQAYGICGEYFLNEIKSHLQIYHLDIVQCFGITQDPNNKEYMMSKIENLLKIARGLLDIHNAEKVHKDFHSVIKICKGLRPTIPKDIPNSDTSYATQTTSANPISECLDVQLSELELNEICQDVEDNIE